VSSRIAAHGLFAARSRSGLVLDVAVAVVLFAVSVAQLSHHGLGVFLRPVSGVDGGVPGHGSLDPVGIALVACSTLPLVEWRRFPLGVFTVTAVAGVVLAVVGEPLDLILGPAVALYLLAAGRGHRTRWTWRTTVLVVGLPTAYLAATAVVQGEFPSTTLSHSGLAWAVAWFAGERSRLRQEHVVEVTERARRAERDAERERLLAAAEERARIARDLHDSAGHAISVIAVRAGAARLRQDPDRARAALEAIEELARHTAAEIDHIVGTLREPGSPNGKVPVGLASLDTLIARHTAAGLPVTVAVSGTPRTPGDATDQAAYRILQEALTNAARHGDGDARLDLAYGDDAIELTVTNLVPAGNAARSSGGHGIVGMHERAALLGGDLQAECVAGTFRLHARVPYGDRR
jgi:signal transduction histidine kinase